MCACLFVVIVRSILFLRCFFAAFCVRAAEERAQYDDQLFDAPDQKKEAKTKRREIDLQVGNVAL
jgi:hypothetical protein